jgi:hypothetical protein
MKTSRRKSDMVVPKKYRNMSQHFAEFPGAQRKLRLEPQSKKVITKKVKVHRATTIMETIVMIRHPKPAKSFA